jgi:hypothetical protein
MRPAPLRRRDGKPPGRPVTITGGQASLRWGYHVAAEIRDWTVTRTRRGGTLRGAVETFNRCHTARRGDGMPQNELFFVTLIQGGAWQWPVRRLEIDDRSVRAELGPQQP